MSKYSWDSWCDHDMIYKDGEVMDAEDCCEELDRLEAENKKLKESLQELREWLKKRMVNYSQTNLGKCTDRVYIGQVLDKLGTFDSDS